MNNKTIKKKNHVNTMYNCRKTMNDDVCLNVAQGKTFTFSTLSFSD